MAASVADGGFESVPVTTGVNYAYQTPTGGAPQQDLNAAGPWQYIPGAGNGLAGSPSGFNVPAGLTGNYAAFLQGDGGRVSQAINFAAGAYTLSFEIGGRVSTGAIDGNQFVDVYLDGNPIGFATSSSGQPFTLKQIDFNVAAPGVLELAFLGLEQGDHTAFIDNVSITSRGVPDGGATAGLLALAAGALFVSGRRRG